MAYDIQALNDGLRAGRRFAEFADRKGGGPADQWQADIAAMKALWSRLDGDLSDWHGIHFDLDVVGGLALALSVVFEIAPAVGLRTCLGSAMEIAGPAWAGWLAPYRSDLRPELGPSELEQLARPDFVKGFIVGVATFKRSNQGAN